MSEFEPPKYFVGRYEQLEQMEELNFGRRRSESPMVVLGPAGSGKTALVARFFGMPRQQWSPIWYDCRDYQADDLVDRLSEIMREKRRSVERSDRRAVILDAPDRHSDDDIEKMFHAARNYKLVEQVIVVTRRESFFRDPFVIRVDGLQPDESEQLFLHHAGRDIPDVTLRQVVASSQGIPKTLLLLAGVLRNDGLEALGRALAEQTGSGLLLPRVEWIDLTAQLIERLKIDWQEIFNISPEEFERLVADRLAASGCDVQRTGPSNQRDGGIDIVFCTKGPHPVVGAAQVKHRRTPRGKTGPSEIRDFATALNSYPFTAGFVVTNTTFTPDAKWAAMNHSHFMKLRDGEDMKLWIQDKFVDQERWKPVPQKIELAPGIFIEIPRPM